MEKEKSPEIEFAIEKLTSIKSIPESAKSHIVLMFLGRKPASMFSMLYKPESDAYPREDFEKDLNELKEVLTNFGLKYKISDEETTEEGLQEVFISIGKDLDSLEALSRAQKVKVGKERDKKLGIALGFPETAVDAYVSNQTISRGELPLEAAREFQRAEFIPSKEHWQDELEEIRERNQSARQFAPRLFPTKE